MSIPLRAPTNPSTLNENAPDYTSNASAMLIMLNNVNALEKDKQELEIVLRSITNQNQVNQNFYNQFRERVEALHTLAIRLIPQRHTAEIIQNFIFLCWKCLGIQYFLGFENNVLNKLRNCNQEFIKHNCNLQKELVLYS